MVVSLGPLSTFTNDVPPNPHSGSLGLHPRCFQRDVNRHAAAVTTASYTYALIIENDDIVDLAWLTPTVPVTDLSTNIGEKGSDFCCIYL